MATGKRKRTPSPSLLGSNADGPYDDGYDTISESDAHNSWHALPGVDGVEHGTGKQSLPHHKPRKGNGHVPAHEHPAKRARRTRTLSQPGATPANTDSSAATRGHAQAAGMATEEATEKQHYHNHEANEDSNDEHQETTGVAPPQPTASRGNRKTQPQAQPQTIPGPVTLDDGTLFFRDRRTLNDWENNRIGQTEARADVAARTVAAKEAEVARERRAKAKAIADQRKVYKDQLRAGNLPEGMAQDILEEDIDFEMDADGVAHGRRRSSRRRNMASTVADMDLDMDMRMEGEPTMAPRVSRGAARLATILGDTITETDIQNQMEADAEEGLIWFPVPPQDLVDLQIRLGREPDDKRDCFACNVGGDTESDRHLKTMTRMWTSRRGRANMVERALQIFLYYENIVRPTVNRLNANMHAPAANYLKPWAASSIYWHFTYHRNDASTMLEVEIEDQRSELRFLRSKGLFMQNSRNPEDIRMCKSRYDMVLAGRKMLLQLYNSKPQNMVMYVDDNNLGPQGMAPTNFTPDGSFRVPMNRAGLGHGGNHTQTNMATFLSPTPSQSPGPSDRESSSCGGGNVRRAASMSMPLS